MNYPTFAEAGAAFQDLLKKPSVAAGVQDCWVLAGYGLSLYPGLPPAPGTLSASPLPTETEAEAQLTAHFNASGPSAPAGVSSSFIVRSLIVFIQGYVSSKVPEPLKSIILSALASLLSSL